MAGNFQLYSVDGMSVARCEKKRLAMALRFSYPICFFLIVGAFMSLL